MAKPSSFIGTYDFAVRALAYNKFGETLGLTEGSGTDEEKINYNVVLAPRVIAQRAIAEKRTETSVEFISIWLDRFTFDRSRDRSVVARRGMDISLDNGTIRNVKAIPVLLMYSICVWSRYLDRIKICIEDYLFWVHTAPKITLYFPDIPELELNPDLHFDGEAIDHSTVDDMFTKGALFVYEMPIVVQGWLLKSPSDLIGKIEKIQLTIYDKDNVSDYESIYVEDSNQDIELENILRTYRTNLYKIVDVDLEANSISIEGNWEDDFSIGDKIKIQESTGNDSVYSINSIEYTEDDDVTVIILEENLRDETIDGHVQKE